MADSKLSALSAAAAVADADLFYTTQSNVSLKQTASALKTYASASPTLVTPAIGVASGTSLALGGATLGSNALAVTGLANISGNLTVGNALMGTWSVSNTFVLFGNNQVDQTAAGNYALLQQTDGSTFLNASTGKIISFAINNVVKATITAGNLTSVSSIISNSATAIPAGGTAGVGLRVSSTSNFGVFFGSGAPSLAAAKGSLYLRSDGSGVADRCYINTDGSTTWTNVVTGG